jgi:hypothetical protein
MNKEKIASQIGDYLRSQGIEPVYLFTIIFILIALSNWKEYQDWDKAIPIRKLYLVLTAGICALGILLTLLGLFGLIDMSK